MKRFLIAAYILLHLWVAFVGVRIWPLTDYPMFGWSYPKRHKIHSYYWAYQSLSGDKIRISKESYGLGDMNTFINVYEGNFERLGEIGAKQLEKAPPTTVSLLLIDRYVQRNPDESFEVKEKVIFKKSVQ